MLAGDVLIGGEESGGVGFGIHLPERDALFAALLDQSTPSTVAGAGVLEVISTDGIKLRMGPNHWLMLRFSGTEPLLRLYCEGPDAERVNEVLAWAQQFAEAA